MMRHHFGARDMTMPTDDPQFPKPTTPRSMCSGDLR